MSQPMVLFNLEYLFHLSHNFVSPEPLASELFPLLMAALTGSVCVVSGSDSDSWCSPVGHTNAHDKVPLQHISLRIFLNLCPIRQYMRKFIELFTVSSMFETALMYRKVHLSIEITGKNSHNVSTNRTIVSGISQIMNTVTTTINNCVTFSLFRFRDVISLRRLRSTVRA